MKQITNYISYIIVRVKMHLRLHFFYPYDLKFKHIKSIIPKHIKIGKGVQVDEEVTFLNNFEEIGDQVYIGKRSYIGYCKSIGSFSSISFDVMLGADTHPMHYVSTSPYFYSKRRGFIEDSVYEEKGRGLLEVGSDVLIGRQVTVLSGVKLGHGCIIGAGSVVNKNVPPYAIVRGIPAKVVAYRFDEEIIKKMLKSKWWEFTEEQLHKYKPMMCEIEKFIEEIEKDGII